MFSFLKEKLTNIIIIISAGLSGIFPQPTPSQPPMPTINQVVEVSPAPSPVASPFQNIVLNKTDSNKSPITPSAGSDSMIDCLGADGKHFKTTKALCDAHRTYWTSLLGSLISDPDEVIECLGADGKYSTVPRKTCEQVNEFWRVHTPVQTSTSGTSSNTSSTQTTSSPEPTPIPTPTPSPTYHLNFDGVDDKIVIPASASLNNLPLGDFTLEFVMSLDITQDAGTIISKKNTNWLGWEMYYGTDFNQNTIQLWVSGDEYGKYFARRFVIPDGNLAHYEFVWNAVTQTARGYRNGVEMTGTEMSDKPFLVYDDDSASDLWIGNEITNPSSPNNMVLNWLRISTIGRHTEDFSPPSLLEAPQNDENTALMLSLDEGEDTVVYDLSGYENDGVITGATWEED